MLTKQVKEYIEKNRELLDTDEGIQQLVDNYIYERDAQDLFEVLRSIGLLHDYESLCHEYIQEVKKHVASSATGINVEPVLKSTREEQSFPHRIEMQINNNDVVSTFEIPLSHTEKLVFKLGSMCMQRSDNTSARISVGNHVIEYVLPIRELLHKERIKQVVADVDDYINRFDSAVKTCINSFQYKEDATELINSLVPKLKELMTSILGYSKIIVNEESYCDVITIKGISKTGTVIHLLSIDYSHPVNMDEDSLMSKAKTYLDKYKIKYDKNQARRAAKQDALAANPDMKIITRKEITQAINASGVNVRTDFVYTNKHKTITTYKYAFNDLTQDECNKIKDELVKIGANVKDVTCEQGWWSGRGAYMSLFIRLYN